LPVLTAEHWKCSCVFPEIGKSVLVFGITRAPILVFERFEPIFCENQSAQIRSHIKPRTPVRFSVGMACLCLNIYSFRS
jgi:hypothetical protein